MVVLTHVQGYFYSTGGSSPELVIRGSADQIIEAILGPSGGGNFLWTGRSMIGPGEHYKFDVTSEVDIEAIAYIFDGVSPWF